MKFFQKKGSASFFLLKGFGTSAEMYYDTTLQETLSRGLKCHSSNLSNSCKFVRLIARYLQEEYNSVFYGKAQNLGRVLCKAYDEALQKYDVLILPTIPKKAPVFPQEKPSLEGLNFFCLIVVTNKMTTAFVVTDLYKATQNSVGFLLYITEF